MAEKIDYGKFTCTHCGMTFDKEWSNEEAMEEMRQNFARVPIPDVESDLAIVCDDCYSKFMNWFEGKSNSELEKIRIEDNEIMKGAQPKP